MPLTVDLNSDMGEGFGRYTVGNDERLLDYVTSANIACGFHAGDPCTMRRTVERAMQKDVAVGAHPGFPDIQGFGRRFIDVTPQEAYELVVYQVGALQAFAKTLGGRVDHVKPHGALYNAAAVDASLAEAIAAAARDVDESLIVFGLAGGELITAAANLRLRSASEVFADRRYESGGTLVPRTRPEALITDHAEAVAQAVRMVKEGKVRSIEGSDVDVRVETICVHGDGAHAVEFAGLIRGRFEREGIIVTAPGRS